MTYLRFASHKIPLKGKENKNSILEQILGTISFPLKNDTHFIQRHGELCKHFFLLL